MKNKKSIILIILTFSVLIYLFKFKCYRSLPEMTELKIVSNLGKQIPAKLYRRDITAKINGVEKDITEIILCFNDSLINDKLNISNKQRLSKFLVVIPDLKMIGIVNNQDSFNVKEYSICQTDRMADTFTSMINNHTFYNNPPIKKADFTNGKIVFNTFGILKQFGSSIIINTK